MNKLTLNPDKTKYMVFSLTKRSLNISNSRQLILEGKVIERVEHFTFLGFTINQHLSWKPHMLEILSKIQRNLGIARKIACFLDRESLLQLYHSLILGGGEPSIFHFSHILSSIVGHHLPATPNPETKVFY